jgi:hypothetical protein
MRVSVCASGTDRVCHGTKFIGGGLEHCGFDGRWICLVLESEEGLGFLAGDICDDRVGGCVFGSDDQDVCGGFSYGALGAACADGDGMGFDAVGGVGGIIAGRIAGGIAGEIAGGIEECSVALVDAWGSIFWVDVVVSFVVYFLVAGACRRDIFGRSRSVWGEVAAGWFFSGFVCVGRVFGVGGVVGSQLRGYWALDADGSAGGGESSGWI